MPWCPKARAEEVSSDLVARAQRNLATCIIGRFDPSAQGDELGICLGDRRRPLKGLLRVFHRVVASCSLIHRAPEVFSPARVVSHDGLEVLTKVVTVPPGSRTAAAGFRGPFRPDGT